MDNVKKIKVQYLDEILEELDFSKSFSERQKHIENLLCAFLNMKTVVAFIGAGTSIPLGHPSWGKFAKDIFELLDVLLDKDRNVLDYGEEVDSGSETKKNSSFVEKLMERTYKDKPSYHRTRLFEILGETYPDDIQKAVDIYKGNVINPTPDDIPNAIRLLDEKSEIKETIDNLNNKTIIRFISELKKSVREGYAESSDDLEKLSNNYQKNKKEFERYREYLKEKISPVLDFQTIFSECERMLCSPEVWQEKKQAKFFRILLGCYFEIKRIHNTEKNEKYNTSENLKSKNYNPYLALLDLPIKKFATFNYDIEIERAIIHKKDKNSKVYERGKTFEHILKESADKSFSQNKYYCSQLANFSVSRFDNAYDMVFHCHGRVDDMENCIVSEEDYQKWYLREDSIEFTPFRQTLDIVLESNPILFLGFSMNDPDFMRILRRIAANRPADKTRKPLFCFLYILENEIRDEHVEDQKKLINEKNISDEEKTREIDEMKIQAKKNAKWINQKELEDECTVLYIKYGLHVIPIKQRDWKYKLADDLSLEEKAKLENWRDLPDVCDENGSDAEQLSKTKLKRENKLVQIEGQAICNKINSISQKWESWWKGVVQKPKFRKFPPKKGNVYFHYELGIAEEKRIKDFDKHIHDELDKALNFHEIIEAVKTNPYANKSVPAEEKPFEANYHRRFAKNLALVVGDGGTGKSWSVQHYLQLRKDDLDRIVENKEESRYKLFFWSSYYANDVLTGIDRLIDFLGGGRENSQDKDKFELLKNILDTEANSNNIIVFDGIEKLLKPNKENTEGESANPEVRKFFKIITNKKVKCRIILTSRLFPTDLFHNLESEIKSETDYEEISKLLDIKHKIKREKILSAPKCWALQLGNDNKYLEKVNKAYINNNFADEKSFLSYLASIFDGHVFAVSLVKGILDDLSNKEDETAALLTRIINTPTEHCVNRVIKEALDNLDNNIGENIKLYSDFIERISLFMHPVRKEVAKVCIKQIYLGETKTDSEWDDELNLVLNNLIEKSLVQKVTIENEERYVVHPLIRSYIFETLHESRFTSLPGLQLPGVTSSKEIVDPGNQRGIKVSLKVFQDLCEEAKNNVSGDNVGDDQKRRIAADLCRAAFSVIRSRFCTNTVCRWGNFTHYIKNLLLLFNTAKIVSEGHWGFNEPTAIGFELCSDEAAPLYSDELAWVYNEIGIALFSMGDMLQSAALLGEGYEINRLIDKEFEGRYTFQSNINKGAVNLHYGKLNTSMNYLQRASEVANKLDNDSLIGRVFGYVAIVKYLRGNLEEANIEFNNSYQVLSDNMRAKSTFLIAHGELLFKLGKYEEAIEKIEQSRHIAESVYYPDLVAYAKLSRANYFIHKGEHIRAQNEFLQVLTFAKEKHLRRLESATLSGMSRLAEKLGDYSTAISRAIEALKISNEYALRLHQTLSLIVLGTALINGNQHRDLGIACLQTAKVMAQKQEYFLRLNEAQDELTKHNQNIAVVYDNKIG